MHGKNNFADVSKNLIELKVNIVGSIKMIM